MTHLLKARLGNTLLATLALILLNGCSVMSLFESPVAVREITPAEYISTKRGDILSAADLSSATKETIIFAGLDDGSCSKANLPTQMCRDALAKTVGIQEERQLSSLAELWTQHALSYRKDDASTNARIQAWLEAARYAYAYLFFTLRDPRDRAFEDRQTQVRDYYNLAVQEVAVTLFKIHNQRKTNAANSQKLEVAGWTIRPNTASLRLPQALGNISELVPASSMAFSGLRSQYRRDGFGAELVAVMAADLPIQHTVDPEKKPSALRPKDAKPLAWSEMPYPTITALLDFQGQSLSEILNTREVSLPIYDPYRYDAVSLRNQRVPLAGNFTAGYGLWLARSNFTSQSIRTLLGRESEITRPHLYLMQPYDPNRRIIVMIHGLASSPEAWVNVANDVMGDETLRENFQVWQVYYPTNMPIALNQYEIRQAITSALNYFDPKGTDIASHNMVLIGHSMGGVLSRLMVSSSGDQLLDKSLNGLELTPEQRQKIEKHLNPILNFEPMPQVSRAIFIAAPHRGTLVAEGQLGRWLAGMIRLPLTVLERFSDILQDATADTLSPKTPLRVRNSVENLQKEDPFIKAAADLKISPKTQYHSIIARTRADGELASSDDGLVPYDSSHLAGANSERVIVSGHSVQETAQAILELRRILHQDLRQSASKPPKNSKTAS